MRQGHSRFPLIVYQVSSPFGAVTLERRTLGEQGVCVRHKAHPAARAVPVRCAVESRVNGAMRLPWAHHEPRWADPRSRAPSGFRIEKEYNRNPYGTISD